MNRLLELQQKLESTGAAIGRLEGVLIEHPSSQSVRANIRSLYKLHASLEGDWRHTAFERGEDVCSYRLFTDSPDGKPTATALAKAIGNFQETISLIYDALKNGPKRRREISPDAIRKTDLRVAYTYPGSFGVVFSIPNDRLIGDYPSFLDMSVKTLFEIIKTKGTERIARQAVVLGRAPIAALYDWAHTNASHRIGVDAKWTRGEEKRGELLVQYPELAELSAAIESTSDESVSDLELPGVLVGADIISRRFHFVSDTDIDIRGRFLDAISESQKAELPTRYIAELTKSHKVQYSTGKEDVSYFLRRLRLSDVKTGGTDVRSDQAPPE